MSDCIDTNKAQLAALGDHQPLCLAKENEALKREITAMADLLYELRTYLNLAFFAAQPFSEQETAILDVIDRVDEMLAARQQGGAV